MKIKITFLSALLLAAIMLSSCADTVPTPPSNTNGSTEQPTTETPTDSAPDPFKNIRESKEDWLFYGLAAYESNKEIKNMKAFFSDQANMTYLTLYDHMFAFDKEKSVPVAEAFFRFVFDKYGIDALVDIDKRCEYKTEYLKSLGLNAEYVQTTEVEAFFTTMDFTSNETYKYIISFDNVTFYFKDFNAGSPSQYHGFLYYSTTGLFEMIKYMKEHNLSAGFDTDRKFNYYMTFDGSGYSKTVYANGNMYINDSYSTLHEAVHTMGITENDNIWLSEGICNYFGKSLGFNNQIAASYIQILTMAKQGYFDERANAGDKSAILYKVVYENYTDQGGKIDSLDVFDLRLYTDVAAKVEFETGSFTTLGEAYKVVNKKDCYAVGAELSYDQSTSLIHYLGDTYGIDKVLEAYHTQNIAGVFGKDYEELKADWLDYLNQRFLPITTNSYQIQ